MEDNQFVIRRIGEELGERDLNFRNRIFHSFVTSFDKVEKDSGLSIKLVLKGEERYAIGRRNFRVTAGRFLVVNHHQQFECTIRSQEPVEALCFYLDPEHVLEAYQRICPQPSLEGVDDIRSDQLRFMEKIYSIHENELGQYLNQLIPLLRKEEIEPHMDFDKVFQTLAEKLVRSQLEVNLRLQNIKNARRSTREEIFHRVSRARNFIDDNYLEDINLEELASLAFLSKYHFLRCFKEVYGISPYQYVIQKRLEHSQMLLKDQEKTLSEIAYQTGFIDRRAFNRAFRKAYGFSPSEYRLA